MDVLVYFVDRFDPSGQTIHFTYFDDEGGEADYYLMPLRFADCHECEWFIPTWENFYKS